MNRDDLVRLDRYLSRGHSSLALFSDFLSSRKTNGCELSKHIHSLSLSLSLSLAVDMRIRHRQFRGHRLARAKE